MQHGRRRPPVAGQEGGDAREFQDGRDQAISELRRIDLRLALGGQRVFDVFGDAGRRCQTPDPLGVDGEAAVIHRRAGQDRTAARLRD